MEIPSTSTSFSFRYRGLGQGDGAYLAGGDARAETRCHTRWNVVEAVEDPRTPFAAKGFRVVLLRYQGVLEKLPGCDLIRLQTSAHSLQWDG